jgi:threonine/homoserine/homoserine lactone efflux protein
MLGTHDPWLFAATVLVVNATPGVDLMLTLTRTLQQGVRGGLATALGVGAGCVGHALAAAFGLAALLAASVTAFSVLKWLGAGYLLWLAIGMLRTAAKAPTTAPATPPGSRPATEQATATAAPSAARLFRQGFLTNALNPKVAIFFLALLPQFIDASAVHKTLAFLVLGAWFVVQGTLFLIGFVLLVAPLARWRPPASVERSLQALGGLLFVGLAARLAFTDRP